MNLFDGLKTNGLSAFIASKSPEQVEKFKKAFAAKVGKADDWESVTIDDTISKIETVIKKWVADVDEKETSVNYTDMDI